MRFKKGGGLDKRFKGAKEKEAALVIIGFVIALVVAGLYFIYFPKIIDKLAYLNKFP